MVRLGKLLDAVNWYELVPVGSSRELVSFEGQKTPIISAATRDGKTLLAYIPPVGKDKKRVRVAVERASEPLDASWYDPTSSLYQRAEPSEKVDGNQLRFVTPGKNASGATDWVLVIRNKS